MKFLFYLKYFLNRKYSLFLLNTDIMFLKKYYVDELKREQEYRDQLVKIDERKKFADKKKSTEQAEQADKDYNEVNAKIQRITDVKTRLANMKATKVELEYFCKLLWKKMWGKNL